MRLISDYIRIYHRWRLLFTTRYQNIVWSLVASVEWANENAVFLSLLSSFLHTANI